MYINQILLYMAWPALIIVSWFAIKLALSFYEKKFSGNPEKAKKSRDG